MEKKNIYNTPEMLHQMGTSTMRPVAQVVKEINEKIGEPDDGQAPTLFKAILEAGKDSPEEAAARKQLAESITAKGVETPDDATMQQMSYNVQHIAQNFIQLDASGMYSKQLFGGDPDNSPLWNLYDVLAQMKNKYLSIYSGLIVCEYYKGYDSLQLQGADAYFTCDGDEYDYDALHVWHDADNGRANRWVAFLFRSETAEFNIVNTDISPRSMYVGGHIGKIQYFVNNRLTEFVSHIEDSDICETFISYGTINFGRNTIIKGIDYINPEEEMLKNVSNSISFVLLEAKECYKILNSSSSGVIECLLPELTKITTPSGILVYASNTISPLIRLYMPKLTYYKGDRFFFNYAVGNGVPDLIDIEVGEMNTNLNLKTWNPVYVLESQQKIAQINANIRDHIAAKVSDRTGLSALTFTVSTNLYNNLEPETIAAFTAKNWNVAGA